MSGQKLPEAPDVKQGLSVCFLEGFKLPLEFSIAGHVHGVVGVLLSHAICLCLIHNKNQILLHQAWCHCSCFC